MSYILIAYAFCFACILILITFNLIEYLKISKELSKLEKKITKKVAE